MILNRDCFFYKKSDFINRLPDISEESICYIADTQQIYVQGRYFECNVTRDIVEQLIQSKGYLTPSDLPVLTGGAASTSGEFVSGVSVGGHTVNVQKGKFSEINAGTASKLETPREIALSGDASGSIEFDGSQDVVIETTVHNSTTADRLTTPRTISLDDQATGQVSFDGSGDVTIPVTVNQLDSKNANNIDLNDLVTLNGYVGNLFYGGGGNTSENKPGGVDSFGLLTFKSAAGNYSTQILGSSNRLYTRSGADASLGSWRTVAYLTDNVASATKLQNTRTFTISDGTHSGTSSNFDGTGNVTLKLPTTINADITGDITGDVVGNVTGDLYGNADTASKLENPVDISLSGDVSGTVSFDGSENVTINTIIANNSHTHVVDNLTDLNSSWNSLLKSNPNIYVTRWPSISEVTGKQNLTIQFNGTTQGGGAYNGTVARTINITPSNIGAATSDHTHTTSLSSNATTNLTVSAGGTTATVADLYATYADRLRTARTISLTGDVTGSVSFNGSQNVSITTTVANDSHSHSNYVTTNTAQSITGAKTSVSNPWAVRMSVDTSNAVAGLVWKNTSGTSIAGLTYHNTVKRIFINANTSEVTNIWEDTAGKYSLRIGWNELTYDNKPILHSGNYSSYTVTKTGGGASGTWGINISGNAATADVSNYLSLNPNNGTHASQNDAVPANGRFAIYDVNMATTAGGNDGYIMAFRWPSGNYATQVFLDADSTGIMALRHRSDSNVWTEWYRILHSGNIGSYALTPSNYTSTLDSRYVNVSGDTMTGKLTVDGTSSGNALDLVSENATETYLRVYMGASYKAAIGYDTIYGAYLYNRGSASYLGLRDNGLAYRANYVMWDSGNDGSGSGLDADLLDGYQGSNYLRSFWTTSPGYDASQYVNDSFSTFTYENNAPYTGPLFHLGARGCGVYFNTAYTYDSPLAYKRHGSSGDGGMGEWQYLARTSDLTWSNISGKPSSFTPASHTHPISQITNRGTLTFTGAVTGRYDGSGNLTINIPSGGMTSVSWNDIYGKPSTFTPSSHNHAASNITSGTLGIYYGGTGASTVTDAKKNLGIPTFSYLNGTLTITF